MRSRSDLWPMSTMTVPFRRVFPVFLFRSHATVFFAADIFFSKMKNRYRLVCVWKKRTIRYREGIELRLVIAEKRSVAFAIAQALGGVRQGDGYVSAGGALISWAQGHLVELSDPEEYSDMPWSAHKWTMDSLPIDPKSWRWRLSGAKGAAQRYRSLVELLRSDKVAELVNACDPDREGEAIFRRILMAAKVSKPSLRLWVASLDEQAIRDAWNRMRPASDYDGLAVAADARAKADWLVGMNASRAHTLAWHRSLSLGRVRTPTLNMVVQRDLAIESHKPTPFWRLIVPMDGWTLESGKIEDQVMARRMLADAMGIPVEILEVRRRREHAKPPTLFDLTGLQKAMSERHGLTAEQTLDCLQHLYEMKVATYPRTDSKYITHDDVDGLKELLQPKYALGFLDQKPVEAIHDLYSAGGFDPMRCVADDKVQGHTAILPTRRLTYDVFQHDLTDMEREVIAVILTRMWAACAADRVHDTVKVDAVLEERRADGGVERVELAASSDTTVEAGWTGIENPSKPDDGKNPVNRIPGSLEKGTLPQAGMPSLSEGVTAPPKPFTEATLLSAMEHASRFVADRDLKAALDDDTSHSGGIGTPATRAGILESLVKSGYLLRKGKQIRSTPAGRMLIGVAIDELKDVRLTAQWEQRLADIEDGKGDEAVFLDEIRAECAAMPRRVVELAGRDDLKRLAQQIGEQESFGPCPRCGKPVVKTGSIWQCSSNKSVRDETGKWVLSEGCGYKIFAEKFGKKLTDSMVRRTLEGKRPKVSGLKSKAGKTFDARLVPDRQYGIGLSFDDLNRRKK